MFNILIDKLPTTVFVDNKEYSINWNAKTMIEISIFIEKNPMDSADQNRATSLALKQLELFYPKIPENLQEAMIRLIEFYTYSKDTSKAKKENKNGADISRIYSFFHDSSLIYTAFLQQYPTKKIQDLHWFEFKAMLEGLTDDCLFAKVMQYRAIKINSNMSKTEKDFYRRMKKIYALPDERSQEQKDVDFANILFNL